MTLIDVPETCAPAINNMHIVSRPIWRLTEGKHIAKLEITWQLPPQPTQRRGNQQKQKKTLVPAENGATSGEMVKTLHGNHYSIIRSRFFHRKFMNYYLFFFLF